MNKPSTIQALSQTERKQAALRQEKEENTLWIADLFQITPAGREQLNKVAQPLRL